MPRRRLLAILAHPDDEVFALGGTVAKYAQTGVSVDLICATSGQAGRSEGLAATPETLGEIREAECRRSAQMLGINELYFLGYQDKHLGQVPKPEILERIVRVIRQTHPQVIVTFGPEGGGNEHPDHQAISRLATEAYWRAGDPESFTGLAEAGLVPHQTAKLYYLSGGSVPWQELSRPFQPVTTIIDIEPFVDLKLAAFREHQSQASLQPKLEAWIAASNGKESFHLAAATVPLTGRDENDLWAGMPVEG